MIDLRIDEIAAAVDGTLVGPSHAASLVVGGDVVTDSREATPGSIFFALPGELSDGHLFAQAAIDAGALLLVVERELSVSVPQIVVADGVLALSALAGAVVSAVRSTGDLKVVAVTGSNGKTTTKNMLWAILADHGSTVAPLGSFNNEVGAPISMLGITASTRYLIVEMGADAVGDITKLVAIAKPDVGIVLTVGLAHVGKFGSPEVTQLAKSEMVRDLEPTACAVLNADDGRVSRMADVTSAQVSWFGLDASADVRAIDVDTTVDGTSFTLQADGHSYPVQLRILGEHHVTNALAAITAARALGIAVDDAVRSLEAMTRAERWRMELIESPEGIVVINDAYNASPDSMAAALKTLAQITGSERRSFAVLGEMAELGDFADEEHDRMGRLAVRLNVKQLVVVGHNARHIHNAAGLEGSWDGESILVDTIDEAYDVLSGKLRKGDVVLVKSSKSAGLRFLGDRLAGITP
ncbi:UDP-N-acetylmuramoyl-tripeptide--D-alanyl-D-alanine ligase [Salinibacterium sp. CAN_S4]|uniref:UDP-N-acetylmuramoyl-tripeptide--D-alanyl-D- alanine ligase n=1 Tax=Salinibacterium sp. CAN_S4 TaxID=2787727 RepID=UPI0018EF96E5